jgi:hypothetical protein
MLKEPKKLKNLPKLSKNTTKLLPSSLNAEDFSPITYKPQLEKKFSSKRRKFTQELNYLLKVLPSYKNTSKVPSRELLNSNTENHGENYSKL